MTADRIKEENRSNEFGYLCIDDFLSTLVDARSLATAFQLRLVDYLIQNGEVSVDVIRQLFNGDGRGLLLLLGLLKANNVIEEQSGRIRLTAQFQKALEYRDLLEAKIEFAHIAAHDFIDFFTDLIVDPPRFMQKADMFKLFSYGKCLEFTKENYDLTKRWMRYTTALTRYEARVCMRLHDFSAYRRMLDIGGNSGEFALQVCKKNPQILAAVFDLPLVCEIGQDHVRHEPEAERISFCRGDALADPLPGGFDLVTFKSVLHDWPDRDANHFIRRAAGSLRPGGTLLIFERGPFEVGGNRLPYSVIPMLLFSHTFRSPAIYKEQLKSLGFTNILQESIHLEMPFFILSAVSPQ